MVNYFYVCSKGEEKYSDTFRSLDCVEGDRNNLVAQVTGARDFCKDERSISYDFFLQSINNNTVLYIKSDSENVLGCCSISIDSPYNITIYGICVPDRGIKGIGTALIDKLKELANSLGLISINLSADPSAQTFYLKNGFKIFNYKDSDSDSDIDSEYSMMRYTLTKGGKKTKKSKKTSKKTNKQRTKRYRGGAEYYAPVGDEDRDSVDDKMESALGKLGISNTPEDGQSGWLSIGIAGILAVGGIGYLLLKKK